MQLMQVIFLRICSN